MQQLSNTVKILGLSPWHHSLSRIDAILKWVIGTLCSVGICWCKDKYLHGHNDVGDFSQGELDRQFSEVFDTVQNFTLALNASECRKLKRLNSHTVTVLCSWCKKNVWNLKNFCLFPAGLPCPRVQFFILRRQLPRETQSPAWFRARSFSETAVCYSSKDGITKDGGGDGGKVLSCSWYRVRGDQVEVRKPVTKPDLLRLGLKRLSRRSVLFGKINRKHQSLETPFSFTVLVASFSLSHPEVRS